MDAFLLFKPIEKKMSYRAGTFGQKRDGKKKSCRMGNPQPKKKTMG
jgi:hypothetical protein